MDPLQNVNAEELSHFFDMAWHWTEAFVPRLIASAIILVVGFLLAGWLGRQVERLLGNVRLDLTLRPILGAIVRYSVIVLVIVIGLSQLGIQTNSLFAVIGAAGLAIGLALQGTLSNIAAGMMLLWLRPFHVGDYIEVGWQGGTVQGGSVEEIGLFGSQLRTFDGLFLFMPNASIWNQPLKNHTRNGSRLVGISVGVPATADLDRVRRTLMEVASRTEYALPSRPPTVFIDKFDGSTFGLNLLIWSTPQGAGDIERTIVEAVKQALDQLGDQIKPSQIVRSVPPDSDPSRFLEGRRPLVA